MEPHAHPVWGGSDWAAVGCREFSWQNRNPIARHESNAAGKSSSRKLVKHELYGLRLMDQFDFGLVDDQSRFHCFGVADNAEQSLRLKKCVLVFFAQRTARPFGQSVFVDLGGRIWRRNNRAAAGGSQF